VLNNALATEIRIVATIVMSCHNQKQEEHWSVSASA
jgi:hypothetical protein